MGAQIACSFLLLLIRRSAIHCLCSHFIALLFLFAIRYGNEAEDTDSSGEEDGEEGKF